MNIPESSGRLVVSNLTKRYGATLALRDVSLQVRSGELHALVGGNGSGKSTLVKILAGALQGEPGGTISAEGVAIGSEYMSHEFSRRMGMHFVHQDPSLFDTLSVADNLALGRGYETGWVQRIKGRELRCRAQSLIERFEINESPDVLVGELSPSKRTLVAIARALQDEGEESNALLVLDEATASLPDNESRLLLDAMRRLAMAGQTVLYVTHRLDEVLGVADRVSVLRDGNYVADVNGADLTETELVELIVGQRLDAMYPTRRAPTDSDVVLELRAVSCGAIEDLSLSVRRGETVGIAGLLGSGRSTILRSIFGDSKITGGTLLLDGDRAEIADTRDAIRQGIGYVPEDRNLEAIFPDLSVRHNLLAASIRDWWRRIYFDVGDEVRKSDELIENFAIKTVDGDVPIVNLSGGNQQKVILARWIRRLPKVLLLDEPTQGVDVGARADIYSMIRTSSDAGMAVLVVASDFEELLHISDRIIVLRHGKIVANLMSSDTDIWSLTEMVYREEMDKV